MQSAALPVGILDRLTPSHIMVELYSSHALEQTLCANLSPQQLGRCKQAASLPDPACQMGSDGLTLEVFQ